MRDHATDLFELHTGSHWHPRTGSLVNRKALTSAVIDSHDFVAARRRADPSDDADGNMHRVFRRL